MFFSIIIPIYNAEKTIGRCLDSVLEQEFDNFEVILVNDGSVDASSVICKQYVDKDKRFIYIEQKNKGVSEARNTGIKVAKGKYLAFLDSDDVYLKNYLSAFYEVICKYPDVDNYWCRYKCLDINVDYKELMNISPFTGEVSLWGRNTIMSLHERALDGAPWNKIFRRDIIIDNCIAFNKDISLGEDMMFNYDYLDKTKEQIILIEAPIYGYYCGTVDSLNNKYRKDLIDIYDKLDCHILNYLKKWKVFEEQKGQYYNSVFYRQENVLRNTFKRENTKNKKEKYQYNATIIRTGKFVEAIKKSDCYIHPVYKVAYMSKKYWLVRIVDRLVKVLKR